MNLNRRFSVLAIYPLVVLCFTFSMQVDAFLSSSCSSQLHGQQNLASRKRTNKIIPEQMQPEQQYRSCSRLLAEKIFDQDLEELERKQEQKVVAKTKNNKNLNKPARTMNRMDFTKYVSMFSVATVCGAATSLSTSSLNSYRVNAMPMEIDKSIEPKVSTVLPSGVKIETLVDGEGPVPAVGDLVAIRFLGTCNGVEFDNLYKTEEPYYYRPGAGTLMPGIEEILPKMRVGDRWKVTVPGALAFGKKGRPASAGRPRIPPMATVVFDISMVGIPGKEGELILDFDDSDESITKYD